MSDKDTNRRSNKLKSLFKWPELITRTCDGETKYSVSSFMLCHWDGVPNELTLLNKIVNSPSGPPYTHI